MLWNVGIIPIPLPTTYTTWHLTLAHSRRIFNVTGNFKQISSAVKIYCLQFTNVMAFPVFVNRKKQIILLLNVKIFRYLLILLLIVLIIIIPSVLSIVKFIRNIVKAWHNVYVSFHIWFARSIVIIVHTYVQVRVNQTFISQNDAVKRPNESIHLYVYEYFWNALLWLHVLL